MSKLTAFFSRHKKLILLLAVLAAAGIGYNAFFVQPAAAAAAAAQAQELPTFALTRQELRVGLKASGSITSAEAVSVVTALPYPVAGLPVAEGDTVAAGDVIAVLDTADLDSQIAAAQRSLSNAQAQAQLAVDQAARHLEDARNQKKIDDENPQELPEASWEAVMRQDSLAIENAQDQLNNAVLAQQAVGSDELARLRRQREECTVTAPCGGVITRLSAQVGAVPAGELALIEDSGSLLLELSIKEYDIGRIALGQKAAVTSGAGGQFAGEVIWIAPRAEVSAAGEATFLVRLRILDPDSSLRLGMSARADIALEVRANVFAVPLDAVGSDAAGNAVVWAREAAEDGSVRFTPIPVTTGLENDIAVEISAPELTEGMQLLSMAPEDPLMMAGLTGAEG